MGRTGVGQERRAAASLHLTGHQTLPTLTGFVFIEFPPYTAGCRVADGGDGSCGSPKGWLKKAANYKFPKTHPAAYKAFSKLSFTTTQVGQMAALVDVEKLSHQDAAKKMAG